MYRITVTHTFSAAHALTIQGATEPIHGHDWTVIAALEGDKLDDDGLLCDFHTVEETLAGILDPFSNNNFNAIPPFDTRNPTAELIARYIHDELAERLGDALAPHAHFASVAITEAPGCEATYLPPHNRSLPAPTTHTHKPAP